MSLKENNTNPIFSIKKLLDSNKKFAEDIIKESRTFAPQVNICVEGQITPIVISGGSEQIKQVLNYVEKTKKKLDWIVTMHEGYKVIIPDGEPEPNYVHGSLEERYLAGDATVKWVFVIQARLNEAKESIRKVRIYEIVPKTFDFVLVFEDDEYEGYLAI